MDASLLHFIQQRLNLGSLKAQAVGGGCINDTYKLLANGQTFFCKVNSASLYPSMFEKEARGLIRLAQQRCIKVPHVRDSFEVENKQVLILEWIDTGERTENFWKLFGERLACLHQATGGNFGWEEDNYMGSVPQRNEPATDWATFFRAQRLEPLIERCSAQKLLTAKHLPLFEKLYQRLPEIFPSEPPALLHGDLWSGNFMCNEHSAPVLIDPAVYFGHRCVDLGMTMLFGGFHASFYDAYRYHFPLPRNYEEQFRACNLYPLLIHLTLFGQGYLSQIERILRGFQ